MTRTFGIELEFNAKYKSIWSSSGWSGSKNGIKYDDIKERCEKIIPTYDKKHRFCGGESSNTWNLKEDGSCGWEVTSPALNLNKQTLDKLNGILTDLKSSFGDNIPINSLCGFHVHFGIADLNLIQFKRLVKLFKRFEDSILDLYRDSRKRNQYVTKLKRLNPERIGRIGSDCDQYYGEERGIHRHFSALNTYRYRGNRKTCEIRYAEGTCDPEDVICWVLICALLIDCAKKNINPDKTTLAGLRDFVTKNGKQKIFKDNEDRMAKWINYRAEKYKRKLNAKV